LKDLAFALAVPADPAFRPLVAEVAGKYAESLGLPEPEARALSASAREAVDLAAGTGAGDVTIEVHREGDQLELTVSGVGTSSTMSRTLTARST
jgi:hypothetical protein